MVNLTTIHNHVVAMLTVGLSKTLTYHNVNHTLDVALQCLAIAEAEGISNKQILLELQIAALYHDTGFLFTYDKHEERSCIIARQQLPGFGLDGKAIDNICELIMATKVPQEPTNFYQNILCDADLDYLGREDFFDTGNNLRLELIANKLITCENDWMDRQLGFLTSHRYFTDSSRQKREPVKAKFIHQLLNHKK